MKFVHNCQTVMIMKRNTSPSMLVDSPDLLILATSYAEFRVA